MLTVNHIKSMIPTNKEPDLWFSFALNYLPKYEITTINRVAGFFAQTAHESGDFNILYENLNYSWEGLRKNFSRYFPTDAMAKEYARNPQKIANRVYNDAYRTSKLGNIYEGDGYRFRGRGLIQLTGRYNYQEFADYKGIPIEDAAVYCGTKEGAFDSSCWYWSKNNLNYFCDNDDIIGMSRKVNGGDIGLEERKIKYSRNKKVLFDMLNIDTPKEDTTIYLQIGSRGEDVKKIQRVFKLSADGIFGVMTDRAVKSWQRQKGFVVNGKLTKAQYLLLVG